MRKRVPKKRSKPPVKNYQEQDVKMNPKKEVPKVNIENFKFKINCKFKNKKQKDLYNAILDNRIIFVRGPAGCGKTMLSLVSALALLKSPEYNINKIVLVKPIVEITSNKGLGALPGPLDEKINSYFAHFYDNLSKLISGEAIKFLKDNKYIVDCVLNYMRGITFGEYREDGTPIGSIVIFDETQNSTVGEMKTFISRMGEGTKLVIMGDPDQIDLKLMYNELCGLNDAVNRLHDLESIALVEFDEDDIVRDPFLIEIMKRYKNK